MSVCEVLSVLGLGVEYHRVAEYLIVVVAHLHAVYCLELMRLGVVETLLGLKDIVLLFDVAAATKLAQ